ncbi:PAS domain S-box protein [Massilia sp. B-10]|nr:PAS domain S-box protein [Massilia sp. B-10]
MTPPLSSHADDLPPALAAMAGITLTELLDGHPVATFVIDNAHIITHWNKACDHLLGWSKDAMIGTGNHGMAFHAKRKCMLSDLIVDGHAAALAEHKASSMIPGAYEEEAYFPNLGAEGHWLHFTAAPLHDHLGNKVGAIETMRDVTERRVAENALRRAHNNLEHLIEMRTAELADANARLEADLHQRHLADAELREQNAKLIELNDKLKMAQQQLVQSEKAGLDRPAGG